MSKPSVKERIISLMKAKGEMPKKLFLTLEDELDMCMLEEAEIGPSLFKAIVVHGPRKAIEKELGGTLFGMEVSWGATATKVE